MISFDFEYIKPETINEVDECVQTLKSEGVDYVYYAGGSELITSFRQGKLKPGAIIDLKGIEGMMSIEEKENEVIIGACVSLNRVAEHASLDVLKQCLELIADHTVRNTLTLGGNICGRLPYREAVLPLLGVDADVVIVSGSETKRHKLSDVFDKRLLLEKDAYLYQIIVPKQPVKWRFGERITGTVEIDYPIVHLIGIGTEDAVTVTLSGYASFPVYWRIPMTTFKAWEEPKTEIVSHFEGQARSDIRGDEAYRQHLLEYLVEKMLKEVSL